MIDSRDEQKKKEDLYQAIEFPAKVGKIKTTPVDWGSKTAYDITIRTMSQKGLLLGALPTNMELTVTVRPKQREKKKEEPTEDQAQES